MVLGAVAAVATASIVGKLLYDALSSPGGESRDIQGMIAKCQSTIHKMDQALQQMPSAS